jgi:hypothetical protein
MFIPDATTYAKLLLFLGYNHWILGTQHPKIVSHNDAKVDKDKN